jgi:hypothetical protein
MADSLTARIKRFAAFPEDIRRHFESTYGIDWKSKLAKTDEEHRRRAIAQAEGLTGVLTSAPKRFEKAREILRHSAGLGRLSARGLQQGLEAIAANERAWAAERGRRTPPRRPAAMSRATEIAALTPDESAYFDRTYWAQDWKYGLQAADEATFRTAIAQARAAVGVRTRGESKAARHAPMARPPASQAAPRDVEERERKLLLRRYGVGPQRVALEDRYGEAWRSTLLGMDQPAFDAAIRAADDFVAARSAAYHHLWAQGDAARQRGDRQAAAGFYEQAQAIVREFKR